MRAHVQAACAARAVRGKQFSLHSTLRCIRWACRNACPALRALCKIDPYTSQAQSLRQPREKAKGVEWVESVVDDEPLPPADNAEKKQEHHDKQRATNRVAQLEREIPSLQLAKNGIIVNQLLHCADSLHVSLRTAIT